MDSAGELLPFQELFLLDGARLLQLTDFRRGDTSRVFLSRNGRLAFFRAAADPVGENPTGNCQLFSVDTLRGRMRQLTHFREGEPSTIGCNLGPQPGCLVWDAIQDPKTREVIFYSNCDPIGANPYGGQLFAMRPDGSKLRQLTSARGRRVETDGVRLRAAARPVGVLRPAAVNPASSVTRKSTLFRATRRVPTGGHAVLTRSRRPPGRVRLRRPAGGCRAYESP